MPKYRSTTLLPIQEQHITLLEAAYKAFNNRDINAATQLMAIDIKWPRLSKKQHIVGPESVCVYWTQQWSELNPEVKPLSYEFENENKIRVKARQIIKSADGHIIKDEIVSHRYTIAEGKILRMDIEGLTECLKE